MQKNNGDIETVTISPPKTNFMANTIILLPQTVRLDEFNFPAHGFPVRKLVFQSELRSLADGNATFGLIAYPLWRNGLGNPWITGAKVECRNIVGGQSQKFPLQPFVAFGNIEVPLSRHAIKTKDEKQEKSYDEKFEKYFELLEKISKDKDLLKESLFNLKNPKLTKNPHADYNITLSVGGVEVPAASNPSPPADPSEG